MEKIASQPVSSLDLEACNSSTAPCSKQNMDGRNCYARLPSRLARLNCQYQKAKCHLKRALTNIKQSEQSILII